jgi:hypothetical protein
VGGSGELVISGPAVGLGYLDGKGDADAFMQDPNLERAYRTGDLVRLRDDAQLVFEGRKDTQLKIHGSRIDLAEIEAAVRRLPGVEQAAVVVKRIGQGEGLCAYYVAHCDLDETSIRLALARQLPKYMVPRRVLRLDALPLTITGKVDRQKLPEPPPVLPDPSAVGTRDVWCGALGVPSIADDDDFFAVGGDSLLAVKVVAALSDRTGLIVGASDLVRYPTIAELGSWIDERLSGARDQGRRPGA